MTAVADLQQLASLPTAALADAVVRLALPPRCAPAGITGPPGSSVAGRALPVRHHGSVDVFFEALDEAEPGDVLVVDNGGRLDEACLGDLVVHEAAAAGVAAVVVWGLHRDAAEIETLGVPVFSYGTLPFGPLAPRRGDQRLGGGRDHARCGAVTVTSDDVVVADADGVLFLPAGRLDALVAAATAIRDAEAGQVRGLRAGTSLREQLDFDGYLRQRGSEPSLTFREHLRRRGGAVEE